MGRSALIAAAVLVGVGCSSPDSDTSALQDANHSDLVNAVLRDATAQDNRIAELESRVLALEEMQAAPLAQQGSPGDWIVWKVEEIHENPNQVIGVWIPPKPMHAYSTQPECISDAARVALGSGGSADSPGQYLRAGDFGTTVLVTLRCLPKEIDPRQLR
jgi:hypothetical protein